MNRVFGKFQDDVRTAISLNLNAILVLFVRSSGALVWFCVLAALAHLLSVAEFGKFVYVYAWITTASVVTKCGLDRVLVRVGSPLIYSGEWPGVRGLFRSCALIVGALSFLVVIIALSAALCIGTRSAIVPLVAIGFLALPSAAVMRISEAVALIRGRQVLATAPEGIARPLILLTLTITVMWIRGTGISALDVIWCNAVAQAIVFGIVIALLLLHEPQVLIGEAAAYDPVPLFRIALPILGSTALTSFMLQADLLVIGTMQTVSAALYAPASRIAVVLSMLGLAAAAVYEPIYARTFAHGQVMELRCAVQTSSRFVVILTICAGSAIVLAGHKLLALFGPAYENAYLPLCLLVLAYIVKDLWGAAPLVMNVTRMERHLLLISLFGVVVTVTLEVGLTVFVSWQWVPLGLIAGLACVGGLSRLLVKRELNVETIPFCASER